MVDNTNINKSLLIITYSFTPHLTPRAIRWSAIVNYMAAKGCKVDVVCSYDPGLKKIEQAGNLTIYRCGSELIEKVRYLINRKTAFNMDINASSKTNTGSARLKGSLTLFRYVIKLLYRKVWQNIYWPDYACLWYFQCRKTASTLLRNNHYDAIISISPPFTGHLVAENLKNSYPNIRWIVDIGDPFCFENASPMNNQQLYRKYNFKREKKIFQTADNICVTNDKTKEIYQHIFKYEINNISVIGPLFTDSKIEEGFDSYILFDSECTNIVYVGNFHEKTREPGPVLRLFNELFKQHPDMKEYLRIHFFGNKYLLEEFLQINGYDPDLFIMHGPVIRSKVLMAIKQADFLMNVGNSTPYQLPSKLVEYMSTGKPIINISVINDDLGASFLSTYPYFLNLNANQMNDSSAELFQFIKNNSGIKCNESELVQIMQPHMTTTIAELYLSLV